ncbi:hypothetical protein ABZW02_20230 [Streptomyces sp. NPDC005180]|uniref:hypothetical protein n=1 Tax=Streptomyces sp. NPDC005180 TaxID=3156868 RepID=UPI0033BB765D
MTNTQPPGTPARRPQPPAADNAPARQWGRRNRPLPALSTTTARQTVKRVNKAMAVAGDHLEAADRALKEVADDLAAAHRGRIWEALGHSGWRAFVDAELDMTRTRSYQILDYAEIRAGLREQLAVESVNSVDTFPAIDLVSALTEESGRGLKKHVPALAAALAEQVQDALADGQELDEDTVKDIVNSAAAGVRKDVQKAKKAKPLAEKKADEAAVASMAEALERADRHRRNTPEVRAADESANTAGLIFALLQAEKMAAKAKSLADDGTGWGDTDPAVALTTITRIRVLLDYLEDVAKLCGPKPIAEAAAEYLENMS